MKLERSEWLCREKKNEVYQLNREVRALKRKLTYYEENEEMRRKQARDCEGKEKENVGNGD